MTKAIHKMYPTPKFRREELHCQFYPLLTESSFDPTIKYMAYVSNQIMADKARERKILKDISLKEAFLHGC